MSAEAVRLAIRPWVPEQLSVWIPPETDDRLGA
jgi:hypothetical protein